MKKYISMIAASLMAVSCVDTIILPENMTVEEDFWKTKSDVELMVSGAYQSMLSSDIQTRLLVWSGLRSDEMVPVANLTSALAEDLIEVNLANIQDDNTFASWGAFYKVINNCNIVLEKASKVLDEDPSYTQGDYLADCSKMLALRSLCYFYLVRNFRDVPYVDVAYLSSSQDRNVAQSAPSEVLERIIADLQTAETNAVASNAYGDWRDVGYLSRDGIQALLADIYLWRGSVMHNSADYEKCVEYCNKVIASKKASHVADRFRAENPDDEFPSLIAGNETFINLYVDQNAEESIFELQYNGTNNGNVALCQYYNHYSGTAAPYLYASAIYGYAASNGVYTFNNGTEDKSTDWRGLMNTYNKTVTVGEFEAFEIRKYVSDNQTYMPSLTTSAAEAKHRVYSDYYQQNFIIYRLADVMLMKAEALAALSSGTYEEDTRVAEAFNLVRLVNARSLENQADSLVLKNVAPDAAKMETLVLQERQRELAFEGKRWYDLLRYNYRHVNGVDYTTTLADQNERGVAFVANYQPMLDLMKQKLGSKGEAVAAKMGTEPRLYMPLPLSDLKISPLLKQNPTYSSNENTSKNY